MWAVSPRHDNLRSLCGYLCDYALEHFRHSAVRCLLEVEDPLPDLPVAPHVRHQLLMAVRESLNNVLKHSGATEVRLGIRMAGTTLLVRISDNGISFDPARMADSPRSGLRNMRERMEEAGGRLTIEAWPAKGTVVCMSLPLG